MFEWFEHRSEPLLPKPQFYFRLLRYFLFALFLMMIALGMGILGYHHFEGLTWVDSVANASMILGGMGPLDHLNSTSGKLFASFYALFSGLFFIVIVGIVLAPVAHRLVHRLHLDEENNADLRQ